MFENLTAIHPNTLLPLERDIRAEENITGRIIDLIAPIGLGQRGLIVAQPKSGKTVMLQNIAHAISANRPDVVMITLDTTRRDHIGCYGRTPSLTPNIDRLCARARRFPHRNCSSKSAGPTARWRCRP